MDAELYELEGRNWKLPLAIRPFEGNLVVVSFCRINYLVKQREIIAKTLNSICERKHDESRWILTNETVAQCLSKSKREDPEDCVAWGAFDSFPSLKEDFVTAYCQSQMAMIPDHAQAVLVWRSFCKFAMRWLIDNGNELDLGFAKINALPMRQDWLPMLALRYRQSRRFSTKFSDDEFIRNLANDSKLTAWDDELGILRWTLCIEPSRSFHEDVARSELVEQKRKPSQYLKRIQGLYQAHARRAYEILKTYLAETPFKNVSFPKKRFRFARNNRGQPTATDPLEPAPAVSIEGGMVDYQAVESSDQTSVDRADEDVHAVPDLRPPTEEVRKSESTMDQAENRRNGDAWMRVLDVHEGEAP